MTIDERNLSFVTGPCEEVRNLEDIPKTVTSSDVGGPTRVTPTELNLLRIRFKKSTFDQFFSTGLEPLFVAELTLK